MTHTITIETQSDSDFTLIKNLAERLGLRINEQHNDLSDLEEQILLERVAGSWDSNETGDDLTKMLYQARQFGLRDIQL